MSPLHFLQLHEKQLLGFLQRLVQNPSQDGVDTLRPLVKEIVHELRAFGFKPQIIGGGHALSIVCLCNKKGVGKTLWLDAPLDTVSVGDIKKWIRKPFSGDIAQGKLYGRGSGDCKAAIAIFVYAAAAAFQSEQLLRGQLILTFDSGEQSGDFTGMRNILKQGITADACIIGYPGSEEIAIGSRGFLRLRMTTKGKSAHTGARYNRGVNAIAQMGKIITGLEKLKMRHKKIPFFSFGPRLTVSQISGGQAINIVPDECTVHVDIRLVPSQTKSQVLKEIQNMVAVLKKQDPSIRVVLEPYMYERAFFTPENKEIVQILKKNAQYLLQREVPVVASGPSNVGNIIGNKGIDTISGFGVDGGHFHSENEFIYIKTLVPVAKVYAQTILDFLS